MDTKKLMLITVGHSYWQTLVSVRMICEPIGVRSWRMKAKDEGPS